MFLGVGSGTHGEQTARALVGIEEVLLERRPDLVVVAGDVNSTLAGALAAVKLDVPIAHLEAGLRSFDRAMPEEHNRLLTDHLSDVLLVHSEEAIDEPRSARGSTPELVHFVGNTMIDSVFAHVDTARAEEPWEELGVEPGGYALVTLHRPALVDDPANSLRGTRRRSIDARGDMPVLFPVHPRTLRISSSSGYNDAIARRGRHPESRSATWPSSGSRPTPRFVAYRLRRRAGGDLRARRPLLHAARLDRATGDGRARDEHCARRQAGSDREIPRCSSAAKPRRVPLWDGPAGARAAEVLLTVPQLGARSRLRTRGDRARRPLVVAQALLFGRLVGTDTDYDEGVYLTSVDALDHGQQLGGGRLRAAAAGLLPLAAPRLARRRGQRPTASTGGWSPSRSQPVLRRTCSAGLSRARSPGSSRARY